jgi:hypothetical protein
MITETLSRIKELNHQVDLITEALKDTTLKRAKRTSLLQSRIKLTNHIGSLMYDVNLSTRGYITVIVFKSQGRYTFRILNGIVTVEDLKYVGSPDITGDIIEAITFKLPVNLSEINDTICNKIEKHDNA